MSSGGGRTRGQRYYLYDQELRRPPVSKSQSESRGQHHSHYHSSSSVNDHPRSRRDRQDDPSRGHRHGHSHRYEGLVARNPPPPRHCRSRSRSRTKTPPPPSRSRSPSPPAEVEEEKKEKEYDLTIKLEPLTDLVSDPRRLLREAMSLLGTKRLNAMIPPALKTMGRRNLEFFCLEELEAMEQGTLLNILAGKEGKNQSPSPRDESSHREVHHETKAEDVKSGAETSAHAGKTAVKKFKTKLKKVLIQETETKQKHKRKKKREKDKSLEKGGEESEDEESISPKKMKKSKKEKKKRKKKKESSPPPPTTTAMPGQKTLMELLELEYRAKAIKALLRTQGLDASRIDSALSLDPPPLSPDPALLSATPPVLAESSKPEEDTSATAGTPVPVPSPPTRSPDSSNVNFVHHTDPDPEVEGDPMTPPEQVDLCSSPEPEHEVQVTSSVDNEEVEVEEVEEECDPSDPDPQSGESEEEEIEFVVEVNRVEETEPEPEPEPKEIEDGEIESGDEEEVKGDPDPGCQIADVYSSEEETAIWSKRVGGASSSDSESQNSSPERRRRAWASDRTGKRNERKRTRSPSPLSDVSLVDLEDSQDGDGDQVKDKVTELSKDNDDTLERISSGEEEKEEEAGLEDLDAIPIITEDGSIVFPSKEGAESVTPPPPDNEEEEEEEPVGRGSDEEDTPLTWYHRWYQSKKVQRQVKANKMYGSLRSKLRREKALPDLSTKVKGPATQGPPPPEPEVSIPIIGSMEEYEKLFGKPKPPEEKKQEETGQSVETPNPETETGGGSEEEEDDDLWGDIMGGN